MENNRPGNAAANGGRANLDRPLNSQPPTAAPVNPALERKHQQQLDQLRQQQAQERQRVEQKHQQEQQKLQQRAADDRMHMQQEAQRKQQLQQLDQKHAQQELQQRQQQEWERQQKPAKAPSPSRPSQNEKPPSQQ